MKLCSIICLFFTVSFAFGQFAIVYDTDHYCNVRSSSGKHNNSIDKLENGHLVYAFPDQSNWVAIDYSKGNKELDGLVYKDRLVFVANYLKIPVLKTEQNTIKFKKDSIEVVLVKQKFVKAKHKFSFYKEAKDQIVRIDNKQYWGKDGGVPTTEYQSIEITFGKKKVLLPKEAIENLYEPSLDSTQVNYDNANDIIYIQSMNSDGAGGYEVIWKIEKGVYKERYVAYGF
jgi:hypothetical protein